MRRLRLAAFTILTLTSLAEAETRHEGSADRRRIKHLVAIGVGAVVYVSSETFLKDDLAASQCRLCAPNGLDRGVRNALVWSDTDKPALASDVLGFVVAPSLALTLTALASNGVADRVGRVVDDTLPIFEAAVFAGLVNQTVKFATGRRRPFVQFGDPSRPADVDDNTSFYSGHTTLGFAIATSATMVAHKRGYRLAPVILGSGVTLALATGYLRIAADRHYLSDVVVGAATGTLIGVTVPLVLHGHIQVAPTRNGVAIAGSF